MKDIDRYLDQACRCVSGPIALRQHLREELKEHLKEAIEELVATGMSQDEATRKAIEGLGEPEMIREGLQSVYGQSVTSLFVDKAMEWKERTMKAEWKWNFAAQSGLVLIIGLTVFFIESAFLFIVPVVVAIHHAYDVTLPGYLIRLIEVAGLIHRTIWIWPIVLAGGMALFEWKCRSENKALIRTAIGVGASLVTVSLAFWVATAIVIPLVQVGRMAIDQQNESFVTAEIIAAHDSYEQLTEAMEEENWPAADEAATEVRDAYRFLRDMGTATVLLAGDGQRGSISEIRRLTAEIADLSDDVHDSIRDNKEPSLTSAYFAQLRESYSQLQEISAFFATHLGSVE